MDQYLNGSEYRGTLSPLTKYGTMNTSAAQTSTKRERGKVRGNKAKPITRTIALDSCKVYKNADDYNAGIVSHIIEPKNRTRNRKVTKVIKEAVTVESSRIKFADVALLFGN